mmetsp:Transcript_39477/g.60708  ORF Transcript_39477/g.60708 Transcript_39477/m.60708 type:complete len:276 (-) Transcript_39477:110-937(-)
MPPKAKKKQDQGSKKAEQKKKQKVIEDRTFGLKNKNKSKKVQQYVEGVAKAVLNSGDRRQRQMEEQRKKHKAEAKMRKKAAEDERNALFGEALLAVKKKKTTDQKSGKMEAKGRDGNEETAKKGTSRAMKMMYQMDAQEMEQRLKEDPNYVPTLEDKIEAERQMKVAELKKSGKGTKVTPETFAVWQEKKRKQRADKARKLVEAELRKKKGGKGLAILSGRDLFEYKKDLFNIVEAEDATAQEEQKDDVEAIAEKVQSDLFLEGDDDDLDDIEDD